MTRAVPIGLIPRACYSGQIGLVEYLKTMVYDDSLYFLFFYLSRTPRSVKRQPHSLPKMLTCSELQKTVHPLPHHHHHTDTTTKPGKEKDNFEVFFFNVFLNIIFLLFFICMFIDANGR